MRKSESNVLGIAYMCASGRGFPPPQIKTAMFCENSKKLPKKSSPCPLSSTEKEYAVMLYGD